MKLITVNIWGGRMVAPLTDFLKKYADVDMFLFQEIFEHDKSSKPIDHPLAQITELLTNHVGYYRRAESGGFGLATFVKRSLKVTAEGDTFVHGIKDAVVGERWWYDVGKNLQYVTLHDSGTEYTVFNLHGLWEPTGKSDSPNRIKQSERIIEFMKKFGGNVLLGGDFNLRPDTESLKMIEQELGLKNLIKEYKITSTRTSLYTRTDEKYADYVFVSPNMTVNEFQVLPDVVSDHAALFVDYK